MDRLEPDGPSLPVGGPSWTARSSAPSPVRSVPAGDHAGRVFAARPTRGRGEVRRYGRVWRVTLFRCRSQPTREKRLWCANEDTGPVWTGGAGEPTYASLRVPSKQSAIRIPPRRRRPRRRLAPQTGRRCTSPSKFVETPGWLSYPAGAARGEGDGAARSRSPTPGERHEHHHLHRTAPSTTTSTTTTAASHEHRGPGHLEARPRHRGRRRRRGDRGRRRLPGRRTRAERHRRRDPAAGVRPDGPAVHRGRAS